MYNKFQVKFGEFLFLFIFNMFLIIIHIYNNES
jgi:hypothetical protein